MPSAPSSMSTREFAEKAGVSTSTVSKWLRAGKINGQKRSGKWVIPPAELSKFTASSTPPAASKAGDRQSTDPEPPKASGRVYTIEQFSAMTYLTEFGVKKWLKEGRLVSAVDGSGNLGVDAASLERPLIKRLVR